MTKFVNKDGRKRPVNVWFKAWNSKDNFVTDVGVESTPYLAQVADLQHWRSRDDWEDES